MHVHTDSIHSPYLNLWTLPSAHLIKSQQYYLNLQKIVLIKIVSYYIFVDDEFLLDAKLTLLVCPTKCPDRVKLIHAHTVHHAQTRPPDLLSLGGAKSEQQGENDREWLGGGHRRGVSQFTWGSFIMNGLSRSYYIYENEKVGHVLSLCSPQAHELHPHGHDFSSLMS